MMLVVLLDTITIIISTYLFIKNVKKIGLSTRYIVYYFFFFIMVLPIFLDYIVGKPVYNSWFLGSKHYGFIASYDDSITRIIYDAFLMWFQYIILYYKRNIELEEYYYEHRNQSVINLNSRTKKGIYFSLILLAFLPTILVIICPINNNILFHLGWREQNLFGAASSEFYYSIEKLSYVGLISSLLLVLSKSKEFLNIHGKVQRFLFGCLKPVWILLVYCNVCIESKRSILIFCMAVLITYLIDAVPKNKMGWVILVSGIAVALIISISVYVKIVYRDYSAGAFDALYTTLRIDYFRDDTTKMLIYSLFDKQFKVLAYPFQSYLMQIGFIFPLDYLGTPRLGYNTYFTCALVNAPLSSGLSNTTTSMYDELIANFGLLGCIIAPFITLKITKIADKQSTILKTFVIAGYVLMVMYSLNYIMWFLEITVFLLFLAKYRFKVGDRYLFR